MKKDVKQENGIDGPHLIHGRLLAETASNEPQSWFALGALLHGLRKVRVDERCRSCRIPFKSVEGIATVNAPYTAKIGKRPNWQRAERAVDQRSFARQQSSVSTPESQQQGVSPVTELGPNRSAVYRDEDSAPSRDIERTFARDATRSEVIRQDEATLGVQFRLV